MKGWVVSLIYLTGLILSPDTGIAINISPAPSQDQQLLFAPPPPIHISIVPNELRCHASIRPGNYPSSGPLQLQVTSGAPGWYMQIQSTDLKNEEDEIGAEEIYIVRKQETNSLNQPQTVMETGLSGETSIEVLLGLQTTRRYKPGTYTGQILVIFGYPQMSLPQIIKVPFEVEVACMVSSNITNHKMYFHYGLPDEQINATANGEITTDTDVCLSLSVMQGRIDCLPMLRPVSSQIHCEDYFIPLVWELRYNETYWRKPDNVSISGKEISWELQADSGKIYYELQCNPRPDAAQSPGDYGMSIVMTVTPIL